MDEEIFERLDDKSIVDAFYKKIGKLLVTENANDKAKEIIDKIGRDNIKKIIFES